MYTIQCYIHYIHMVYRKSPTYEHSIHTNKFLKYSSPKKKANLVSYPQSLRIRRVTVKSTEFTSQFSPTAFNNYDKY